MHRGQLRRAYGSTVEEMGRDLGMLPTRQIPLRDLNIDQ